jgi:hypothetical protein
MLVSPRSASGPHEVFDLATGADIATAEFGTTAAPASEIVPVGGDSGDVIVALPPDSAAGFPEARLLRADPTDASHPVWSRTFGQEVWLGATRSNSTGVLPVGWRADGSTYSYSQGIVDVETGDVVPQSAYEAVWLTENAALRSSTPDPKGTVQLSGVDRAGNALWTDVLPAGSNFREISSLSARPGGHIRTSAGTDLVASTSEGSLLVIDATDGRQRWVAALDHCAPATAGLTFSDAFFEPERNAIVLAWWDGRTCAFDADSGARAPIPDIPSPDAGSSVLRGWSVDYVGPVWSARASGSAYDRATGRELWQTETQEQELWYFAGGVLIRERGRHIEPLG